MAVLGLLAVAITGPALAQGGAERSAWEGYHGAVAEEANLVTEYNASLAKLTELKAQLAALDRQIAETTRALDDARARLADADERLRAGRERLVTVRDQLSRDIALLKEQAVAAYISGGSTRTAEAISLARARTPGEFASTREYAGTVAESQAQTVDRVTLLEAEVATLERQLTRDADQAREARDHIAAHEKALNEQRASTDTLRNDTEAEAKNQRVLIARVQAKKADFERRLYAIERESDGIQTLLTKRQKDQKPLEMLPTLRAPLERTSIVSSFGMRLHPIFNEERMHYGIDLPSLTGDPVYAAADGVVALIEEQEGYGLVTVIDHGGQIASVYGHQSAFGVKVGQTVKRGQVIGKAGNTGYSTGPHVHFEYRLLGKPIDPTPFVDLQELLPETCQKLAASTRKTDRDLAASRPECAFVASTTTR